MGNLTLKQKVLLLTLIPLIVVLGIVMFVVNIQLRELGEYEIEELRNELMVSKQDALKSYVDLSVTAIEHIYKNASADDQVAKEDALKIMTQMSYGEKEMVIFLSMNTTALTSQPVLSHSCVVKTLLI